MKLIAFVDKIVLNNTSSLPMQEVENVRQWLKQWTCPNNFRAVLLEVETNNPEVAVSNSQAFQQWTDEFNRLLCSVVFCKETQAHNFIFKVKYSVIKDGNFWINGDSYCEIIPKATDKNAS